MYTASLVAIVFIVVQVIPTADARLTTRNHDKAPISNAVAVVHKWDDVLRGRTDKKTDRKLQETDFEWEPYLIYNGTDSTAEMSVLWKAEENEDCEICWDVIDRGCSSSEWANRYELVREDPPIGDLGPLGDHSSGDHYQYTIDQDQGQGLDANSKYYYRVKCGAGCIGGSFYTPPPNEDNITKLVAYGDSRSYPEIHDVVAKAIIDHSSEYAHIVLHTGDFVANGECMGSWDSDPMNPGSDYVRELMRTAPFQVARGNHENSGGCLSANDEFGDYDSLFNEVLPYNYPALGASPVDDRRLYYSFNYGSAHICVLDQYDDEGDEEEIIQGSPQYQWLSSDLDAAGSRWRIVMIHRPIFSANPNRDDYNEDLQELFETKNVDLVVLAGHDHFYARWQKRMNGKRIYQITTGGGGSSLYTPDLAVGYFKRTKRMFHYTQIDARSDYFCFEAINVNVAGSSDSHNEGRETGEVIDFFEINPSNRPNGNYGHCKCRQNYPDDCLLTEECSNDGHCVEGGWVEIFSEGFENGLGDFRDGGDDARRRCYDDSAPDYAHTGFCSVRIRDDSSSSFIDTKPDEPFGVSGYNELRVAFWFLPVSMESGEEFSLDYMYNDGDDWINMKTWASGTDFQNGRWYLAKVDVSINGEQQGRIRISCDASRNNDHVHLDDIVVLGRSGDIPSPEPSATASDPPSNLPSAVPSSEPTVTESAPPSNVPSAVPSSEPTVTESASPSLRPSRVASSQPSSPPSVSNAPTTMKQTSAPSDAPSESHFPSSQASFPPSVSNAPSSSPSSMPSPTSSSQPSEQPTPVKPACTNVEMRLTTDTYPQETSWEVKDSEGGTVFGGVYPADHPDDETTYSTAMCLDDGSYTFTIYDSWGDGICCEYGDGSYSLSSPPGGKILSSGGPFESSESCGFVCDSSGCDAVNCYVLIFYEDFEGGLGEFNDYDSDHEDAWWGDYRDEAYRGYGFIRIQDNSGDRSSIYSNSFDVSAFNYIEVSFYFKHDDFESGEEFVLEYNDGVNIYDDWILAGSWNPIESGYDEGEYYFAEKTINVSSLNNARIRFRCDASSNSDDIYIDNVMVRGQTDTTTTSSATSSQKQTSNVFEHSVESTAVAAEAASAVVLPHTEVGLNNKKKNPVVSQEKVAQVEASDDEDSDDEEEKKKKKNKGKRRKKGELRTGKTAFLTQPH